MDANEELMTRYYDVTIMSVLNSGGFSYIKDDTCLHHIFIDCGMTSPTDGGGKQLSVAYTWSCNVG